jgi:hypothetical protein
MNMLHSLPAPAPPRSRSQDGRCGLAHRSAKSAAQAYRHERRPCLGEKEIYQIHQREALRAFADKYACKGRHAGRATARAQCDRARGLRTPCTTSTSAVAIETCALNELSAAAAGRNCVRREQVVVHVLAGRAPTARQGTTAQSRAQITVGEQRAAAGAPKLPDMCAATPHRA